MSSDKDIEAELSYAYLHAVASHAGMSCQPSNRIMDNHGVDAIVHVVRDFGGTFTENTLHIQLKATIATPAEANGKLSYFLQDLKHYEKLRRPSNPQKVLCVLFLPPDKADWLVHGEEGLVMKRCGYWVSLNGAPDSENKTGLTLYLPKIQTLSPDGLVSLMTRLSHEEELTYAG